MFDEDDTTNNTDYVKSDKCLISTVFTINIGLEKTLFQRLIHVHVLKIFI